MQILLWITCWSATKSAGADYKTIELFAANLTRVELPLISHESASNVLIRMCLISLHQH